MEIRVLVVKTFYGSGESYAETARRLRTQLGRNAAPAVSTIRRLMQKFERTSSTGNIKSPGRPRSQRIQLVTSPAKSLRRRLQELGLRSRYCSEYLISPRRTV